MLSEGFTKINCFALAYKYKSNFKLLCSKSFDLALNSAYRSKVRKS